jgi:hypothetical protein
MSISITSCFIDVEFKNPIMYTPARHIDATEVETGAMKPRSALYTAGTWTIAAVAW